MTVTPLNGTKTHPLSPHAIARLKEISDGRPVPAHVINPGVINRFQRSNLIELIDLPSPYKTGKGKKIAHIQITQAGLDFLASLTHSNE